MAILSVPVPITGNGAFWHVWALMSSPFVPSPDPCYFGRMEAKDVLQRCPLCHESYQAEAVFPLDGQKRSKVYHCYCHACKRAMLAVLFEASGWLSSVGMLTEFTAAEARRAPKLAVVDGDVCLKAHRCFQEGSQAFCAFLQKQAEKPSSFAS